MTRVAIALILCLLAAPSRADDSIRFVVAKPSVIVIERTPSGGWRVTIEPLDGKGGEMPDEPPVDDAIGRAFAALGPLDQVTIASILINQTEMAIAAIEADPEGAFFGGDVEAASLWLTTTSTARLGDEISAPHVEVISIVAKELPSMPGEALKLKLTAMKRRLEGIVNS